MSMPSTTAQLDRVTRTAIVRIADETTGGTEGSTFLDCRLCDTPTVEVTQTEIENMQQSEYLADDLPPTKGLKSCTFKGKFYPAGPTTAFVAATTPADEFQSVIFRNGIGGEQRGAGSLVVASPSPTTTAFSVTPGGGASFAIGQIVAVAVGSYVESSPISAISTDAITVKIPFSQAPATGAVVFNTSTYYYKQAVSGSISVRGIHATDTNYQWSLLFCLVSELNLKINRDGFLECEFGLKGGYWSGPDALSYATTAAANDCVAPNPFRDARCYLMTAASPARTHMAFEDIQIKTDTGLDHTKGIGGSTEGLVSVVRTGKRSVVTVTLKVRTDRWQHYLWENRTDLLLLIECTKRNGATTRGCAFLLTGGMVVGKPVEGTAEEREITTVTLRGQRSKVIASPSGDLQNSPYLFARW